ncbi:MAG: DUF2769 domain-containing protein [Promethearchaeota archaeon]
MNEIFEDKMKMIANLSQEEIMKRVEEVKNICINYCGKCPSYEGTQETDFGFCITGKSSKITEEKSCICKSCPITKGMVLRWVYYCIRGSGRELSAAERNE